MVISRPFRYILAVILLSISCPVIAKITVTDDAGNIIHLKKTPHRIISLAPNITELLFSIGAGNSIVATTHYSNYPKAALKIPRLGSYTDPDIEAILEKKPDLIIAWKNGSPPNLIRKLKKLNQTIYLLKSKNLKDIPTDMKRLGQITGHYHNALIVAARFEHHLKHIKKHYEKTRKISVFYQLWDHPLITTNKQTLINEIILLCGGKNIFKNLHPSYPTINIANVLSKNPAVIIANNRDQLKSWHTWKKLTAVKKNNLCFIPPDLIQRYSPRILDGAKLLCECLDKERA